MAASSNTPAVHRCAALQRISPPVVATPSIPGGPTLSQWLLITLATRSNADQAQRRIVIHDMFDTTAGAAPLPRNEPRYFMGIGDPAGIPRGDRARDPHVRLRPADAQLARVGLLPTWEGRALYLWQRPVRPRSAPAPRELRLSRLHTLPGRQTYGTCSANGNPRWRWLSLHNLSFVSLPRRRRPRRDRTGRVAVVQGGGSRPAAGSPEEGATWVYVIVLVALFGR